MLTRMVLLLQAARLLLAGFWTGVGAVRGAAAGCGAMASIGMGGSEGVGWAGFGTVPEVEAIGEEDTVLGGDEEDDDYWAGLAEVLALGVIIFGIGIGAGAACGTGIDLAAGAILGWIGGAWSGINSAVASPPVTQYLGCLI